MKLLNPKTSLAVLLVALLAGCQLPMAQTLNSRWDSASANYTGYRTLKAFSFRQANNPNLPTDFPGVIHDAGDAGSTITVTLPPGVNRQSLVADFTAGDGGNVTVAGVNQRSGMTPQDFRTPVIYTVTDKAGVSRSFSVDVTYHASSELLVLTNNGSQSQPIAVNLEDGNWTELTPMAQRTSLFAQNLLGDQVFLSGFWQFPKTTLAYTAPAPSPDRGAQADFTPEGKYFVSYDGLTSVSLYPAAGATQPVSSFTLPSTANWVVAGPVTGTVYVLGTVATGALRVLTYDGQGKLSSNGSAANLPAGVVPADLAIAPDGHAVYVLGSDGILRGWSVTGALPSVLASDPDLGAVSVPDFPNVAAGGGQWGNFSKTELGVDTFHRLAMDPSGRWVALFGMGTATYPTSHPAGAILTFTIDVATRKLSYVGLARLSSGSDVLFGAADFGVDPTGSRGYTTLFFNPSAGGNGAWKAFIWTISATGVWTPSVTIQPPVGLDSARGTYPDSVLVDRLVRNVYYEYVNGVATSPGRFQVALNRYSAEDGALISSHVFDNSLVYAFDNSPYADNPNVSLWTVKALSAY